MHSSLITACLIVMQPAAADVAIDFDTQIMPIFSVAGCNTASCHGAATGQGGFHLSLFGGDPAHDYRVIARQLEGRRVNLYRPDESLLSMKATGEVEHGGEQRFEVDSASGIRLRQWISEGARRIESRQLTRLSVEVAPASLTKLGLIGPLVANAHFDDGTVHDVSEWCTYWTSDDTALQRQSDGIYQLTRPGQYWIFVRYLSQIVTVPITAPIGSLESDAEVLDRNNWIDDPINAHLERLRLVPSSVADDATFVRRLYLDITGRLPNPEQTKAFLTDSRIERRASLIDDLLASDESIDYWTYRLGQWLRFRVPGTDVTAARTFHAWLRDQVVKDRGWNQITRDLLLASGDSQQDGPATFHRLVPDARKQAEYFSEVMLGVRLRCANCHNHPLDRWTQDDYHGLAQIFASIQRGQTVMRDDQGFVIHPRTGQAATAAIPGLGPLPADTPDAIVALTTWTVDPGNPYFAKAMVNRLWTSLMGKGLVDPVDDTRATNPPSHQALLDALARDFVKHEYKLRPTLRTICLSAAYQRESAPIGSDLNPRYLADAIRRPLSAEVLADAIADVTGFRDLDAFPVRAINLVDLSRAEAMLTILGRCDDSPGCVPELATRSMSVATRLHLINGPLLNARIGASSGNVARLIQAGRDNSEIVSRFYYLALSRSPTSEETSSWCRELAKASDSQDRRQRVEDFVWSMLNCQDFVTNH